MKLPQADIHSGQENLDNAAEIETKEGERLIAKVLCVFHDEEYDEHQIFYELLSPNMVGRYRNGETAGEYGLDFSQICTVKPANCIPSPVVPSSPEPKS